MGESCTLSLLVAALVIAATCFAFLWWTRPRFDLLGNHDRTRPRVRITIEDHFREAESEPCP